MGVLNYWNKMIKKREKTLRENHHFKRTRNGRSEKILARDRCDIFVHISSSWANIKSCKTFPAKILFTPPLL
jgi:hypothetical protein